MRERRMRSPEPGRTACSSQDPAQTPGLPRAPLPITPGTLASGAGSTEQARREAAGQAGGNPLRPHQLSDHEKPLSFFSTALVATRILRYRALHDSYDMSRWRVSSARAGLCPDHCCVPSTWPSQRILTIQDIVAWPPSMWVHLPDPQYYDEQHYVDGETEAPRDTRQTSGRARIQSRAGQPGAHTPN